MPLVEKSRESCPMWKVSLYHQIEQVMQGRIQDFWKGGVHVRSTSKQDVQGHWRPAVLLNAIAVLYRYRVLLFHARWRPRVLHHRFPYFPTGGAVKAGHRPSRDDEVAVPRCGSPIHAGSNMWIYPQVAVTIWLLWPQCQSEHPPVRGAFHNPLSCVNSWLVANSKLNDKLYDTRFTTLVVR